MAVACAKWKVTLPNIVIRGGALYDKNLQLKGFNYSSKDF